MPPQMLAVRQRLAPRYTTEMGDYAISRRLGCAIALLAAGGCQRLFQVEGAPRADATSNVPDTEQPLDAFVTGDAPAGHDEDHDRILDSMDYCPSDVSMQADADSDMIGDECDTDPGQLDMRAFFDPMVPPLLANWMFTPGEWTEGLDSDSVSATPTAGQAVYATRELGAISGSLVVWLEDAMPANDGDMWGAILPSTPTVTIPPVLNPGCSVLRSAGLDYLLALDGSGAVTTLGPIPGAIGHSIRISIEFDQSSFISCSASRDGGVVPSFPVSVSLTNGGGYVALFSSVSGATFDSALAIEPQAH